MPRHPPHPVVPELRAARIYSVPGPGQCSWALAKLFWNSTNSTSRVAWKIARPHPIGHHTTHHEQDTPPLRSGAPRPSSTPTLRVACLSPPAPGPPELQQHTSHRRADTIIVRRGTLTNNIAPFATKVGHITLPAPTVPGSPHLRLRSQPAPPPRRPALPLHHRPHPRPPLPRSAR